VRVAVTLEQCWHRVPGGTARATLDTVAAIEARGGVTQVGVSAKHRDPAPEAWRPSIPVRQLWLPRIALYDAWQRLGHPVVERATGPVDLVHATGHVAAASTAPLVVSVWDLSFVHDPSMFTKRGISVFTRFLDLVRERAAMVIVPSEATRQDCADAGIDAARLRVVPLATAPRAVGPDDVARVRAVHHLERPYVLFVGTVEPRKNLRRLLEAYAQLGEVEAELVLVGPEGWHDDLPATSARRLGFVPREHLDALYAGASIVAYPSLREGFGLPVLDAMAHGAPVVTSATTSTAEVAGDAALLVDPLDVDAIAGALQRLLDDEDLAARLGAAAKARAAEFTWARTADGVVAAYEAALGVTE
jgi:glycosyltransferase involved in cell wall biosynthesis